MKNNSVLFNFKFICVVLYICWGGCTGVEQNGENSSKAGHKCWLTMRKTRSAHTEDTRKHLQDSQGEAELEKVPGLASAPQTDHSRRKRYSRSGHHYRNDYHSGENQRHRYDSGESDRHRYDSGESRRSRYVGRESHRNRYDSEESNRNRYDSRERHRSRNDRNSRRHRHPRVETVYMPNNKTYEITVPSNKIKKWNCSDPSSTITLDPKGVMAREEYNIVKDLMSDCDKTAGVQYTITKLEKIVNPCMWLRYRVYRKTVKGELNGNANEVLLFHGEAAVQPIVDYGFDERNTSKAGNFGAGLYFATNTSKGHGQAGTTGKMLLCRVTLGNVKQYTTPTKLAHAPPGYHSVEWLTTEPEYVVYRGEQVYPEYLITYTKTP